MIVLSSACYAACCTCSGRQRTGWSDEIGIFRREPAMRGGHLKLAAKQCFVAGQRKYLGAGSGFSPGALNGDVSHVKLDDWLVGPVPL